MNRATSITACCSAHSCFEALPHAVQLTYRNIVVLSLVLVAVCMCAAHSFRFHFFSFRLGLLVSERAEDASCRPCGRAWLKKKKTPGSVSFRFADKRNSPFLALPMDNNWDVAYYSMWINYAKAEYGNYYFGAVHHRYVFWHVRSRCCYLNACE